jgi:hypothetical protein
MKPIAMFCLGIGWCTFDLFAKSLPPLPEPSFIDGEVSRCYPFNQSGLGSIWLDLTATFVGTASNNLEIAFGHDADHDGELSLRETDLIFGWSCGRYFLERFKACEVYGETNVGTNDVARLLEWRSRVRRSGRVQSLALTNECGAAFADLAVASPTRLCDVNWNLLCVTARGANARDAALDLDVVSLGSAILIH